MPVPVALGVFLSFLNSYFITTGVIFDLSQNPPDDAINEWLDAVLDVTTGNLNSTLDRGMLRAIVRDTTERYLRQLGELEAGLEADRRMIEDERAMIDRMGTIVHPPPVPSRTPNAGFDQFLRDIGIMAPIDTPRLSIPQQGAIPNTRTVPVTTETAPMVIIQDHETTGIRNNTMMINSDYLETPIILSNSSGISGNENQYPNVNSGMN